jgi:hypothetical protein
MFIFTLILCLKINNYALYRYLATGRSFTALLRASLRDVVRDTCDVVRDTCDFVRDT